MNNFFFCKQRTFHYNICQLIFYASIYQQWKLNAFPWKIKQKIKLTECRGFFVLRRSWLYCLYIYSAATIFFNQNKSLSLSCFRKKLYSSKTELNYNSSLQQTKSSVPQRKITLRMTSCLLFYDQVSVNGSVLNKFLLIFAHIGIICPLLKQLLDLCHKLKDQKAILDFSLVSVIQCFLGFWAFSFFSDLQSFCTFENISDVCYLFSAAKYFSIMKIQSPENRSPFSVEFAPE